MKRLLVCMMAGLVVVAFSAPAMAGTLDDAKVGLHLQPKAGKNNCTAGQAGVGFGCDSSDPGGVPISNLSLSGGVGVSYDFYIVILDVAAGVGVQGVELGMSFDAAPSSGLDMFGTTALCADQEFSGLGWPNAGGAATYTWLACQNTPDGTDPQGDVSAVAAVLYAYAYGPDTACVVPKPSTVYGLTDCAATSTDLNPFYPENSGCVDFGGAGGTNDPCFTIIVPVEETTWGAIKSQFKSE